MSWQSAGYEAHRPPQTYQAYREIDFAAILPQRHDDDDYCFYNAGTCPECGSGMVRSGACFSCPTCGFGSCSG